MKNLQFLSLVFLMGLFTQAFAQETYFPVSFEKEITGQMYQDALDAAYNSDYATFEKLIKKVIKKEPQNFAAQAEKALWAYHKGQKDAFKEAATAAVALNPSTTAEKTMKDILSARLNNWDADVNQLAMNLASYSSENAEAHLWNAFIHLENGNNGIALEALYNARRVAPQFGPTYNFLGYVQMDNSNFAEAERMFKKYIKLSPDMANPYDSMGDYYMEVKNYEKAIEMYNKALSIDKRFKVSKEKAAKAASMLNK